METKKISRDSTLRRVTLILGTVLALFFLLAFGPKLMEDIITPKELPSGREWEGQVMTALFVIYMSGYILGWWKVLWGGIMMVFSAFLVSLPFIIAGNFGSLIFGIPVCIVGMFYVILYFKERSVNKSV